MTRLYRPEEPVFDAETYREWITQRKGTKEQLERYQRALDWYQANPEKDKPRANGDHRSSKLSAILRDLLCEAEAAPGSVCRQQLAGGLRVDIKIIRGHTYLQLSRENIHPSETEWLTVLQSLPVSVYVAPAKSVHQGRYYLTGNWKLTRS